MTIRDHLRKKKARYLVIGALCLVATFSLIATHGITRQADYSHAGMALLLGYLACVLLSQGIACPRCRGRWVATRAGSTCAWAANTTARTSARIAG